jgi:hypothetical protein
MGQVHVWKYIHIVARNPSPVLSRNRKTELRIKLDKCTYPEDLASGMKKIGTQECGPAQLENLVTQSDAVIIAYWVQMELESGIQGLLQSDSYLFDDHQVAKYAKWTVDSQVSWLVTASDARQAYTVSLTRLWGLFEGRS